MRTSCLRTAILLLAIVVSTSLTQGCGSGTADNPAARASCLDLAPAAMPASGTVTLTVGGSSTCEMLTVDVMVTDVSDVYAASFGLAYDASIAEYTGLSIEGSLLSSDGAAVEVLDSSSPGLVSVGLTRLGSSSGIDVSGSGVLVRFFFSSATDAGDGSTTFRSPALLGSETPPATKPGIQWYGGTLLAR